MKSLTILLDSSCWIEIFRDGKLAQKCQRELENASIIVVPAIIIYEIYRKIAASVSEDQALSCVAILSQYKVVDHSRDIALYAADLSLQVKLPMADSMVLAHARQEEALLITLDNDFSKISGVKIIR